jgi:GNAT superfamily N-acetyltransferase
MEILEYSQVDPLEVLHLNLLCLDHSLTPERAAMIRSEDPRAFPFFCVYGQVDGAVAGQVGVYRLPVVSTNELDEVGGVWAVSTHPSFSRLGIAYRLMEEAHERMRAAGLSFSTLGTGRHLVAHRLYEKLGYKDVFSSPRVIARLETLPIETGLRAERAGSNRLPLADHLFEQIAGSYLGFARRHIPFFPSLERMEYLSGQELWLLWKEDKPVGYAAASLSNSVLKIGNLLLFDGIDPVTTVAAVAHQVDAPYVQVRVDRLVDTKTFIEAGFRIADVGWGTFMVKPLAAGITVDDFRRLYGVGTDRFLISYMDIT